MTSLYDQFHPKFFSNDLKFCIAIIDILNMSTCYFEEKWGRERRRGQHGGQTNAVRGHHLCLTDTIF